ncbi:cold-shock protein [Paenibacillus methanolicus]|uniref:Cold-inducible protein YdjO n=1 Tax=Paenibacillus methanolicus TaxID=582686 RepID=A0A5S5BS13_9BACL|nr:cold-shock protein [Paenibacillus methanolicus]TYP69158.1 cold-inducible protein YdjO [Paenibacillus methanolicus]
MCAWNKPLENLPEELTMIWSCTNAGCKGWMRDNFSFKEVPVCSQCKSPMVSSERSLPILMSSDTQVKQFRRNQQKAKAAE